MTRSLSLAVLAIGLALAGCAQTGRYPVSGNECKATDPVLGLNAADCVPPAPPPG